VHFKRFKHAGVFKPCSILSTYSIKALLYALRRIVYEVTSQTSYWMFPTITF